jgi:predicted protein tyrosine phosphatase
MLVWAKRLIDISRKWGKFDSLLIHCFDRKAFSVAGLSDVVEAWIEIGV